MPLYSYPKKARGNSTGAFRYPTLPTKEAEEQMAMGLFVPSWESLRRWERSGNLVGRIQADYNISTGSTSAIHWMFSGVCNPWVAFRTAFRSCSPSGDCNWM